MFLKKKSKKKKKRKYKPARFFALSISLSNSFAFRIFSLSASCQANPAHNNAKDFPLPVGLSSNALSLFSRLAIIFKIQTKIRKK